MLFIYNLTFSEVLELNGSSSSESSTFSKIISIYRGFTLYILFSRVNINTMELVPTFPNFFFEFPDISLFSWTEKANKIFRSFVFK